MFRSGGGEVELASLEPVSQTSGSVNLNRVGVLRNVTDPASLFARLTRRQCEQLLTDGVIAGGMIPKVEACFESLDAGAKRAVILDGRQPYALLNEFVSDRVLGTEIVHHELHE